MSNPYLEGRDMPRFKEAPMDPTQVLLFSQSVDEALPAESDVRGFNDVMNSLDYSSLESRRTDIGCPSYPPKVLVKVLGYAYSKGIRSSRKIEDLLKVDMRFIWLTGGLKPDHNTIARFRKEKWRDLVELFKDSVRVCCEAGLVHLRVVSTDGSKIQAAASKRRMYSKQRVERELVAIEKILQEAEEVDRTEDDLYGSASGPELPDELKDAKRRKQRLEEIAKRLRESKKSIVVETDPESRAMWTSEGVRPAYNLQLSVDAENQIVVGMKLTDSERDCGQLPEMTSEVEANTGLSPDVLAADSGYSDEATVRWSEETNRDVLMPLQDQPQDSKRDDPFASRFFLPVDGRDALICPAGKELAFKRERKIRGASYRKYGATGCQSCPFYRKCVKSGNGSRQVLVNAVAGARKRLRDRLRSAEGRELFSLRQETIEPVFGRMKTNMDLDRFILWGIEGVTAESALVSLAHNALKVVANAAAMACLQAIRRAAATIRRFLGQPGRFLAFWVYSDGAPCLKF
jgi:transposase